jgi:amino acid permease
MKYFLAIFIFLLVFSAFGQAPNDEISLNNRENEIILNF